MGYGNLGKACKKQIEKRPDEFILVGIFSRRQSKETILLDDIAKYKDDIDIALFCGSSSDDAPIMVPHLNQIGLSTVDSYDNHGEIANGNYLNLIQAATDKSGTTAIVGAGWDPGYLSVQRVINKAIMPYAVHNTLYGPGLSMGHTNAIKSIRGVRYAHQITVPRPDAQIAAANGVTVNKNDRHIRQCFIVAERGGEIAITQKILGMEEYFKNQQVEVNFIGIKEFNEKFTNQFAHAGQVISVDDNAKINLRLEMKNNPMLTASCMIAFAKANFKMQQNNKKGVFTADEVPPALLIDDYIRINEI